MEISRLKRQLMIAAGLLCFSMAPMSAQAQGIGRGAQEGAATGNRAAGPVGGAVGGVVGGAVGGVVGGVKGVLGVPQRTEYRRHHGRTYYRHGRRYYR